MLATSTRGWRQGHKRGVGRFDAQRGSDKNVLGISNRGEGALSAVIHERFVRPTLPDISLRKIHD